MKTTCLGSKVEPGKDADARRVWLVDDSRNVRKLIGGIVGADPGIIVDQQFDSAETMLSHLAIAGAPEVILMDIQMTGMSGLEALRPLRELAPETAVVIMTAFHDGQSKREALEQGAGGFIVKSAALAEFVRVLREATPGPVNSPVATRENVLERKSVGNYQREEAPSSIGWARFLMSRMRLFGKGVMSNFL